MECSADINYVLSYCLLYIHLISVLLYYVLLAYMNKLNIITDYSRNGKTMHEKSPSVATDPNTLQN